MALILLDAHLVLPLEPAAGSELGQLDRGLGDRLVAGAIAVGNIAELLQKNQRVFTMYEEFEDFEGQWLT